MKKIRTKIKTIDDFNKMSEILSERLRNNEPISNNGMLDGMIIGFILTTKFAEDLFLGKNMGRVLDGTIQKLEQISIWVLNNEDVLYQLL